MKYIIAIDIGGTTFNTGIFTNSLKEIEVLKKDKIRYYDNKNKIIDAIINQINTLIIKNNINKMDIIGIGIASPGPLNSKKGIILNTPNLKIFQNYNIVKDFEKRLNISTYIENDANLFALGEWYSQYKKNDVLIGVTLGTGLGCGLVINGELFKGGNGQAMEYGLSPFKWGICEKNVCINFIRERAKELYGKEISPVKIEDDFYNKNNKAIKIYNEYGNNLGLILSHFINMIDPKVITIGGGLSNAFNCFKDSMYSSLKKHSLSFNINKITIAPQKTKMNSIMLGASIVVKNIKK